MSSSTSVPVLAAIGRRSDDFLMAWLWHRQGVYADSAVAPVSGTLVLEDIPAGTWTITWWDSYAGTVGGSTTVQHPGGTLRLATPPIAHHAALLLERTKP